MTSPTTIQHRPASPLAGALTGQGQFKRHKVLPRPKADRPHPPTRVYPTLDHLVVDTSRAAASSSSTSSGSQTSSPRTLRHSSKRIGTGPDLPPTPPSHSRSSSGSHAPQPASPVIAHPQSTPPRATRRAPTTPPDQRSPPTPDVTPPQLVNQAKFLRPSLGTAWSARTTPSDSRTESFKTAREELGSSEDEDGRSTVRPALVSRHTSQSTVRETSDPRRSEVPLPHELDFALSRLHVPDERRYTPRTRNEFSQFDGDMPAFSDVEQGLDDDPQRLIAGTYSPHADGTVTPTTASSIARPKTLREQVTLASSSHSRHSRAAEPPSHSNSESPVLKSSEGFTVVGAVVFSGVPHRQRILRHVRKQDALRESMDSSSHRGQRPSNLAGSPKRQPLKTHPEPGRHNSTATTMTNNSISSRRARREVWKNGGIPVVVVPERKSSSKPKSSGDSSLRSTSSRRSKRTMSLTSAPMDEPSFRDAPPPLSNQSVRRERALSFTDGSDQRTIDFPPSIPVRSSSLSAPTSRNNSRAGSMTAHSLQARDALQHDDATRALQQTSAVHEAACPFGPARTPFETPPAPGSADDGRHDEGYEHGAHCRDHQDVPYSPKKISSRNTPFSAASIETNGTAPEVSEALAIHMYPHQNSSLLMVDHSARPSDASDTARQNRASQGGSLPPEIAATASDGDVPATPPQPPLALEDVDSPLRNPRAPPEPPSQPPAINFIPATPSGMTPAHRKAAGLGNYFEAIEQRQSRRPSIVRRALSRRRHSVEYPPSSSKPLGFLARSLSFSRRSPSLSRSASRDTSNPDMMGRPTYPQEEDTPPEEDKLHPFWRSQYDEDEMFGHESHYDEDAHVYRYPPIDNRPRMPRRSLSERMKRTFAIMPIRDEKSLFADDSAGPERRTIKRTASGNLRVMRRSRPDSYFGITGTTGRPCTAPDHSPRGPFWQGRSVLGGRRTGRRRRNSLETAVGEIQRLGRLFSERRREKRSRELRRMISGPRAVRDGVGDVIRSSNSDQTSCGQHGEGNA